MSATEFDSDYLTLESVQYIFTVCVRLRLPHEIRYLAILIFTRFSLQFRFLFPAVLIVVAGSCAFIPCKFSSS